MPRPIDNKCARNEQKLRDRQVHAMRIVNRAKRQLTEALDELLQDRQMDNLAGGQIARRTADLIAVEIVKHLPGSRTTVLFSNAAKKL